jgi:pSer/pThr/pTyr-binding forkhead associated (FHA) protein
MATLRIVVDGAEQRFPLEAAAVTLGRGLESDIRLKDIKASRRHCQIVKTPKGYQCVDLSSGNGTYVNGVQIKQQMLGTGDRITIGSTTVTFEEAAPAPAPKAPPPRPPSSRTPTEKLPLAAPARTSPSPSSSRSGVASEKVPVAPTRKITARVEAAKTASSQGSLKPVGQALAKTASRVGKPVDPAQARPGRASGPRTARPPAEPARKKNPLILAAAAGAVLVLGVGAYFLFSSNEGGDQVKAQIDQLVKRAEKAEKADHVDEAIQDYRKALELCEGDRYKMRRSEIGKLLQSLESRRASASAPKGDPKEPAEKGPDFQAKKTEISEKNKLAADPAAADWNGALKDWGDFQRGRVPDETKARIAVEMAAVQAKAKEDAERLRKKAEALAHENKMAEAVDLLRQQLPRFSHPALKPLADDLQSTLRKYDK